MYENVGAVNTVYIVHNGADQVNGSQFMVQNEFLMTVEADPYSGLPGVAAFDCSDATWLISGGRLAIGIDYIPMGCLACLTVPTKEATWGRVKALYH